MSFAFIRGSGSDDLELSVLATEIFADASKLIL